MEKRWNILTADTGMVNSLYQSLKINTAICKILVQRGIVTYQDANTYFRPEIAHLHNPLLMKDMEKAIHRIVKAINENEKILVFGDYDVDGTTSVAMMYQFLLKIYTPSNLDYYIPHRYKEGYGISKSGIEFAKENGFGLIISLDCGIKSTELIGYAKTLGIDFIVCDHHLPDDILPDAIAILNPKQKDCPYPYKELCGCGVGFKLVTALAQYFNMEEEHYLVYLDLVATAIAADIVPMTGENRVLAFYGLQKINTLPNAGIKALIQLGGLQKKLSINNVVFVIAPRINAAGRMDDAKKAVQLFIEKDFEKALQLAEILHVDNSDRKEADSSITGEALYIITNDETLRNKKTTVVYKEHWHKGVVGIVASRIIETYYRPTVVLTENLIAFTNAFEKVVAETIPPHLLIPEILIDAEIGFDEIKDSFYNIINQMEPFGPENMRPVFIAKNILDTGYSKIVKELHIRFVVKQKGITLTGIGFNLAEKFTLLQMNKPLDIVFTLDENEWNGTRSLQLKVIDFNLSDPYL